MKHFRVPVYCFTGYIYCYKSHWSTVAAIRNDPPVRGNNPRALANRLSPVDPDKLV